MVMLIQLMTDYESFEPRIHPQPISLRCIVPMLAFFQIMRRLTTRRRRSAHDYSLSTSVPGASCDFNKVASAGRVPVQHVAQLLS